MSNQPSPAGDNGRNPDGTSAKGNRAACGNPFAQRAAKLRTALLDAVSDDDIRAIVQNHIRFVGRNIAVSTYRDRHAQKPAKRVAGSRLRCWR